VSECHGLRGRRETFGKLLPVFVVDTDDKALTTPDK